MRQSIGETFTYNIIILFIIIVFGILSATLSYYKAFKVNNRILASIEKFEGYNELAKEEISGILSTLGYTQDSTECQPRGGIEPEAQDENYYYCVYYYENDTGGSDKDKKNGSGQWLYSNYAVVSYIYIDLPLINMFKVPVYTKGERTYNFTLNGSGIR